MPTHRSFAATQTPQGVGVKSLRHMLWTLTASGIVAASVLMSVSLWGAGTAATAAIPTFVAKDGTADILPPPLRRQGRPRRHPAAAAVPHRASPGAVAGGRRQPCSRQGGGRSVAPREG